MSRAAWRSRLAFLAVLVLLAAGSPAMAASAANRKAAKPSANGAANAASSATTGSRPISRGDHESPMIALTFDDAPHPEYVPRLLALFRAENVKVTFFLVGEQLKLFPDVARAIAADGHEIGNHSLNHRNLGRAGASLVETEIGGMQQLIKETVATTPTLYRPPFGNTNSEAKRLCEREHLSIILWDVDTDDWRAATTREMIVRNVLDNATSGSIVLFHATHQKTVEAVSELIPILRQRGLEFVTVSRLLQDRALREEMRRFAPKKEPPSPTRWTPAGPERYRSEPAAPTTFSIQTPVLPTP